MNGGTCVTTASGQQVCHCAAGFTGRSCATDTNECAAHPCHNNGTCIDQVIEI